MAKATTKTSPNKRLTKRQDKFVDLMADPNTKTATEAAVRAGKPVSFEGCTIYGLRRKDSEVFIYVGSAFDSQARFKSHLSHLRSISHCNLKLQIEADSFGIELLESVQLASVSVEHRFTVEYDIIESFIKEGHPLTNIVRSLKQHNFIAKSNTLEGSLYRSAVKLLKFNRLNATTYLWQDVVRVKRSILNAAKAPMMRFSPEFQETIQDIVSRLDIPNAYKELENA